MPGQAKLELFSKGFFFAHRFWHQVTSANLDGVRSMKNEMNQLISRVQKVGPPVPTPELGY